MLLLVVRIAFASALVHGYSGGLQIAGCICRSLRSFLVVGFFEIVFRLLRVLWILEIGSDSALSLTQSIVIVELDPLTRLIFLKSLAIVLQVISGVLVLSLGVLLVLVQVHCVLCGTGAIGVVSFISTAATTNCQGNIPSDFEILIGLSKCVLGLCFRFQFQVIHGDFCQNIFVLLFTYSMVGQFGSF